MTFDITNSIFYFDKISTMLSALKIIKFRFLLYKHVICLYYTRHTLGLARIADQSHVQYCTTWTIFTIFTYTYARVQQWTSPIIIYARRGGANALHIRTITFNIGVIPLHFSRCKIVTGPTLLYCFGKYIL